MRIGVLTQAGAMHFAAPRTPNVIADVAEGTRIVAVFVDGRSEPYELEADGTPIVVGLPAIRRIRNRQLAA